MFEEESSRNSNEILIEEVLTNIWEITVKIKRELDAINELVKENGNFCSAVVHTNQSLLKILEGKGIDLSAIEEEEEEEEEKEEEEKNNGENSNSSYFESENGSNIVRPLEPVINRFSKIPEKS
ncbi:PREDICTED: uncharacterized protein LOC107065158 [Polistes dominula]|uniref:Uncharacterized protein LOC107065158 n=1 Tax=Polistes dominula TaxID=743375 RepID=A0ABM1I1J7_POLDO|nr:PREDICTED: uncharacterized protein LOC107065158 [Polistes dominula]